MRFTKNEIGMLSLPALRTAFSAPTDKPSLADITISTASVTPIPSICSPRKSKSPGVSTRLILFFFHSKATKLVLMEIPRRISSLSKSLTVLPSLDLPIRLMTPALNNAASTKAVLPAPPCPMTVIFRIFSLVNFINNLPWICYSSAIIQFRAETDKKPHSHSFMLCKASVLL